MIMNEQTRAEFAAAERGSAAFWYFPARVLITHPDSGIMEMTESFLPLMAELASGNGVPCLAGSADLLAAFVEKACSIGKEKLEETLNIDYTTLFLAGMGCVRTSESAWLSPGGLIMQDPWDRVMDTYRAWSFKKPAECKEPEDHIGVELLFLSALSNTAADVIEAAEGVWEEKYEKLSAARSRFITGHLGKWAGLFSAAVAERSKGKLTLYAGAAKLAEGLAELYK